jgi:hypothetical protein
MLRVTLEIVRFIILKYLYGSSEREKEFDLLITRCFMLECYVSTLSASVIITVTVTVNGVLMST